MKDTKNKYLFLPTHRSAVKANCIGHNASILKVNMLITRSGS